MHSNPIFPFCEYVVGPLYSDWHSTSRSTLSEYSRSEGGARGATHGQLTATVQSFLINGHKFSVTFTISPLTISLGLYRKPSCGTLRQYRPWQDRFRCLGRRARLGFLPLLRVG